jgi:hypothetical protein
MKQKRYSDIDFGFWILDWGIIKKLKERIADFGIKKLKNSIYIN